MPINSRRNIFEIVEGTNRPKWLFEWEGVDVTGYTLTLRVRTDPTASPTEFTAVITDAAAGEFEFTLSGLPAGLHPCELATDDGASGLRNFRGFYVQVPEEWT